MSAKEVRDFWRCRNTSIEMLQDRNYVVTSVDELEPFESFATKFSANGNMRSAFSLIGVSKSDPEDRILMYFTDSSKKLGIKSIKFVIEKMEERGIRHGILVSKYPLTSFATNTLLELEPNFHIEFFLDAELLVNVTKHEIMPVHIKLTPQQREQLLAQYKIKDTNLPHISHNDAVARYYGLNRGDIVKIIRRSESAGRYVTYRLCV